MRRKSIVYILIIIVILPIFFYSVYEFIYLEDSGLLIDQIYQRQMNSLLYSVNNHAWDTSMDLVNEIDYILNLPSVEKEDAWNSFFYDKNSIQTIFVTDSLFQNFQVIKHPHQKSDFSVDQTELSEILKRNNHIINQLYSRKKAGYNKIEALSFRQDSEPDDVPILLMYISESYRDINSLVIMQINVRLFVENVLNPVLGEVNRGEFNIGVFKSGDTIPISSIGKIDHGEVKLERQLWLLPDHTLGIAMAGTSVEDMTQARFQRSLVLILVLGLMLAVGAYILNTSIRREMEVSRMKSEFVSNVSHELRTPLSLIRMFAELIELDKAESLEERKKFSKIIGNESERLTHIINNILDFSKIEAGKKEYHFEKTDINDIIKDILNIYSFYLENKGFKTSFNFSPNPLVATVDKVSVSEIMVNLIDNAVKYSKDSKSIIIRTGQDEHWIYIEIEDEGIGIPKDKQKQIFDKFYRISDQQNNYIKGSGLGLAMVQIIMKAHNGNVVLASTPGKGSRFRLNFPVSRQNGKGLQNG